MKKRTEQSNSEDFIDEILNSTTPAADENTRKLAINSAVSAFNKQAVKNEHFAKKSLWVSTVSAFKSLNNHRATSTIAACLGCLTIVSIMPSYFDKQEIQLNPEYKASKKISPRHDAPPSFSSASEDAYDGDVHIEKMQLEEVLITDNRSLITNEAPLAITSEILESETPLRQKHAEILKTTEPTQTPQFIAQSNELKRHQAVPPSSQNKHTLTESSSTELSKTKASSLLSINDNTSATYNLIKRHIVAGNLPPINALKTGDHVNYFNYNHPQPEQLSHPLKTTIQLLESPWDKNKQLVHIGIKGYETTPKQKTSHILTNDVRLRLTFNPESTSQFRLVGYQPQTLKNPNISVIYLGNITSGKEITLLYEIPSPLNDNQIGSLELSHTLADTSESTAIKLPVMNKLRQGDAAALFSIAVASFGEKLMGYTANSKISYNDIASLANNNRGDDITGHKAEFIELVKMAELLEQK